ncbi:MAG: SUF system Fe-S cluster assembly protein [Phycisphaerales bacterium]|nr:SUF system Fe-S cluster assembly protein [Phycisphaerales bacterium]
MNETNEPTDTDSIKSKVLETLKTVYDPEIPVNIYELGLIYDLTVGHDGMVDIRMTLTSPACPVAGTLPGEVEAKVKAVEGVNNAKVELVWEPAWTPERMSEAAKLQLNMGFDAPSFSDKKDKFTKLGRIP